MMTFMKIIEQVVEETLLKSSDIVLPPTEFSDEEQPPGSQEGAQTQ